MAPKRTSLSRAADPAATAAFLAQKQQGRDGQADGQPDALDRLLAAGQEDGSDTTPTGNQPVADGNPALRVDLVPDGEGVQLLPAGAPAEGDQADGKTDGSPAEGGEGSPPAGVPATEGEKPKRKYTKSPVQDIPTDEIPAMEIVPETEWASHPLTPGATRKPGQIRIDNDVKALHAEWVKAGKPEIRKAPRARYTVTPELAPAYRKMITSAGTLHNLYVKVNPSVHTQDGKEVLVFTAMDRQAKAGRPKGS